MSLAESNTELEQHPAFAAHSWLLSGSTSDWGLQARLFEDALDSNLVTGETSIGTLQAGYIELATVVRALRGDWTAPAPGYEGWTCRDLLAHLSSTVASLPAVATSVTEPKDPHAAAFDSNRWNASQVRRRADKEAQELIDEYDAATKRLVEALSNSTLDTHVTIGAYAGDALGEAMAGMLEHQRRHLSDLKLALTG